jgi:hypothetical protein
MSSEIATFRQRGPHTWLIALRVLLELGDKFVEVFLLLLAILQRSPLQFGVVSLYLKLGATGFVQLLKKSHKE